MKIKKIKSIYKIIFVIVFLTGCVSEKDKFPVLGRIENKNITVNYRDFNGKFFVGDCLKYYNETEYFILLVDYLPDNDFYTFTPIEPVSSGSTGLNERMINSTVTYYTRDPNKTDNFLKLMGGRMPSGYFGLTIKGNELEKLKDSLKYLCSFNLDPKYVIPYGGTAYHPSLSFKSVIDNCKDPYKTSNKNNLLGKEIAHKIPINKLCR